MQRCAPPWTFGPLCLLLLGCSHTVTLPTGGYAVRFEGGRLNGPSVTTEKVAVGALRFTVEEAMFLYEEHEDLEAGVGFRHYQTAWSITPDAPTSWAVTADDLLRLSSACAAGIAQKLSATCTPPELEPGGGAARTACDYRPAPSTPSRLRVRAVAGPRGAEPANDAKPLTADLSPLAMHIAKSFDARRP